VNATFDLSIKFSYYRHEKIPHCCTRKHFRETSKQFAGPAMNAIAPSLHGVLVTIIIADFGTEVMERFYFSTIF